MTSDVFYTIAEDSELNDLLSGHAPNFSIRWTNRSVALPHHGATGVLWRKSPNFESPAQPIALVIADEDLRRTFGRFAQLRSDLSPLSSWCHIFAPERFATLDSLSRETELSGLEAAWTGLCIAEAQLLSDRPLSHVRLPACFATVSFAVARMQALWGDPHVNSVIERFERAHRIFRGDASTRLDQKSNRVRAALQPIWNCLSQLGSGKRVQSENSSPVDALRVLRDSRERKMGDEARDFAFQFVGLPESNVFSHLSLMSAEDRLRVFDQTVEQLQNAPAGSYRRNALAMLAGYLATVVAGGMASLSLAERHAQRAPEILAWAYTIGSLGEKVTWTSAFDGLARYVARELTRPARFDEPPSSDLALDEVVLLHDPSLADPLVHLRLKQARVISVAIHPGVNISLSFGGETLSPPAETSVRRDESRDPIAILADALLPYLRSRLDSTKSETHAGKKRGQKQSQPQLPLRDKK